MPVGTGSIRERHSSSNASFLCNHIGALQTVALHPFVQTVTANPEEHQVGPSKGTWSNLAEFLKVVARRHVGLRETRQRTQLISGRDMREGRRRKASGSRLFTGSMQNAAISLDSVSLYVARDVGEVGQRQAPTLSQGRPRLGP